MRSTNDSPEDNKLERSATAFAAVAVAEGAGTFDAEPADGSVAEMASDGDGSRPVGPGKDDGLSWRLRP